MESASQTARMWRERVVSQQQSGMGVRVWCRANGCAEHAFYVWRAKLGMSPVGHKSRGRRVVTPVGFARVVVDSPPRPTPGSDDGAAIRLSLLGGRELVLPGSMPVEQIARLVRAIEGACPESTEGAV